MPSSRTPEYYGRRGTRHHKAKLDEERVAEIRLRAARGEKLQDLAARYGVHYSTVWRVSRRRGWTSAK